MQAPDQSVSSVGSPWAVAVDIGVLLLPYLLLWVWFAELGGWPYNDDPFYGRVVQWVVNDGRFELARLKGRLSASTVSHVAAGVAICSVLEFSYRNLFLVCILQQWLGGAAIYGIGRTLSLSRGWSLLLGLSFTLSPLYFAHAFTFMTDGPGAACEACACFAAVRAFVTIKLRWLVACSAAVAWGFWMRQTILVTIGAPLTALCLLAMAGRNPFRNAAGFASLLTLPAIAVLLLESGWIVRADLPRIGVLAAESMNSTRMKQIAINGYGMCLFVGLFGLPLVPVLWSNIRQQARGLSPGKRRGYFGAALMAAAIVAAPFVATQGRACLTVSTGWFIQNAHLGPVLLSDLYEPGQWGLLGGVVWPQSVWQCVSLLCISVFGPLAWWGARVHLQQKTVWMEPGPLSALALGFIAAGVVAAGFHLGVLAHIFDRYWLVLLPLLMSWLALAARTADWRLSRAATACTCCLLIALFALNVVFVHDLLAWNNVRWRQVNRWLAEGISPREFDGGVEANAWYRIAEDPNTFDREGDPTLWWSGFATHAIAAGPRTGWNEVTRLPWTSWATGRQHELHVLKKQAVDRPQ